MRASDSDSFSPKMLAVGFDEAGRGPLAGPVCAAAVILPDDFPVEILNDSKKLSEKKRIFAEGIIKQRSCWAVALVEHDEIDRINILRATMLAMSRAFLDLQKIFPAWLERTGYGPAVLQGIVDGNRCPEIGIECRCEPKADGKYPQVMAASILAKTCRDRIMLEMDEKYPAYGYARHKGYPTAEHREICRRLGPSPIQRLTFRY